MYRILHASIPADDPAKTADVLAELLSGEAMPFPPAGPEGRIVWAEDGVLELEIVRRGDLLHRGPAEAEWRPGPAGRQAPLSEVHLALTLPRDRAEVLAIAARAGWPARICQRGGGLFELVELWVEGAFLIEVFDPEQAAGFARAVSRESWRALMHAPH